MPSATEDYLAVIKLDKAAVEQELDEAATCQMEADELECKRNRLCLLGQVVVIYEQRAARERAEADRKRVMREEREEWRKKMDRERVIRSKLASIWDPTQPLSWNEQGGKPVLSWVFKMPGIHASHWWRLRLNRTCDALGVRRINWNDLMKVAKDFFDTAMKPLPSILRSSNVFGGFYQTWKQVPYTVKDQLSARAVEGSPAYRAVLRELGFHQDWLIREVLGSMAYRLFRRRVRNAARTA